jgi:hypothetical protein
MQGPELKSFRESRWRYLQFVVVGLLVAGLAQWLSPFGWPVSLAIGALAGIGLLLVEKRRGVL